MFVLLINPNRSKKKSPCIPSCPLKKNLFIKMTKLLMIFNSKKSMRKILKIFFLKKSKTKLLNWDMKMKPFEKFKTPIKLLKEFTKIKLKIFSIKVISKMIKEMESENNFNNKMIFSFIMKEISLLIKNKVSDDS